MQHAQKTPAKRRIRFHHDSNATQFDALAQEIDVRTLCRRALPTCPVTGDLSIRFLRNSAVQVASALSRFELSIISRCRVAARTLTSVQPCYRKARAAGYINLSNLLYSVPKC